MNAKLGINPLTWSNDDLPALGDDIPLETCLAEAAACGYAGVELGRKFPRDSSVLGPLLDCHGLALASGWYSLRLVERDASAEFAAMQPHLGLLSSLGCNVMVCAEVTGCVHGDIRARLSSRPQLPRDGFVRFTERLSQLAKRMREAGMRLAYHHHMGTVIETESEIDALMQQCAPDVWLLLDTGHLYFAGGDPAAVAGRYASRIAHVHCKDIRAQVLSRTRNGDTSFLEAVLQGVFTVPGDGCIDFASVLAPIAAADYAGWLVVEAEQDPAVADPVTYARKGFETLSNIVSRSAG